jgi:quinol monooxygenase YgiN
MYQSKIIAMKVKTLQSISKTSLLCITICLMLSSLPSKTLGQIVVKEKETGSTEVAAILTRYDVKKGYEHMFQKVLKNYVAYALVNKHNIMAEAYSEQEQPSVMWVIERWNSKDDFDKSGKTHPFGAISSLSKKALLKPAQAIWVKDLEPVSRQQWRTAPAKADKPITIMLFVDAKPGTEHSFQEIYHKVMPQFRSETGVINYQLSQLLGNSTQFVTYEQFRSEDAFQYHLKFPPIQPVIDYLNTSIIKQPFQTGLHRLVPFPNNN